MKLPTEINIAVGMMRQWLNEDRIKDANKFVSNTELHVWLDQYVKKALQKERDRGALIFGDALIFTISSKPEMIDRDSLIDYIKRGQTSLKKRNESKR